MVFWITWEEAICNERRSFCEKTKRISIWHMSSSCSHCICSGRTKSIPRPALHKSGSYCINCGDLTKEEKQILVSAGICLTSFRLELRISTWTIIEGLSTQWVVIRILNKLEQRDCKDIWQDCNNHNVLYFSHLNITLELGACLASKLCHCNCIAWFCPFVIIRKYWVGIFISQRRISWVSTVPRSR